MEGLDKIIKESFEIASVNFDNFQADYVDDSFTSVKGGVYEVLQNIMPKFWDYFGHNQIAERKDYHEQEQIEMFKDFLSKL